LKTATHNIEWMDSLRALATFGVIIIHVCTPVIKMTYGGPQLNYWWIGNIFDSCVRFAVPAFLMLSGASLLSKEYKLKDFYKKRVSRVLVPFLFWMLAYLVFAWFTVNHDKHYHGLESIYSFATDIFVEKGISMHFWFVYMLLFLYIFTPFLGRWVRNLQNKTILYVLVAWLALNLMHMLGLINTDKLPLLVNKVYGYIKYSGYMVLGYYLYKQDTSSMKFSIWSYILLITSILFASIMTYFASKHDKSLNSNFYANLSINTIAQSVAVFILMKKVKVKNKFLAWIRDIVSQYSYGIYLVHIMVIGVFYLHDFFWTMAHPLISIPVVGLSTLIVSALIIYILQKIPVLKYISGYK
jgi:surface polysaccharide O-acyltransferase-like enzyme